MLDFDRRKNSVQLKVPIIFIITNLISILMLLPTLTFCQDYYQREIEELSWSINSNPDDINAYIERGLAYFDSGQYDLAIRDFSYVLDIESYNIDALYYRGLTYGRIEKYHKAISDFETLLNFDPYSVDAYRMLGFVHYQMQEYEHALEEYNSGIDLDPYDGLLYLYRADTYFAMRDYDRALGDYTESLKLEPYNAGAYCSRANTHLNLRNYKEVLRDCDFALRLESDYAFAYLLRGNAFYEMEEYDSALVNFTSALDIDPSLEAAREWRSYTESKMQVSSGQTYQDNQTNYDFDNIDTAEWFTDLDQVRETNYSAAQIELINRMGPPESFTLMMVALEEDSEEIVRNEIWNYYSLDTRFIFLRGELIMSEELAEIDSVAVLPDYTPDQFTAGMSFADVLEVTGEKEFVLAEIIDEYIESGDLYYTEQLVLGFKDDQLFFVESQPLIAAEE